MIFRHLWPLSCSLLLLVAFASGEAPRAEAGHVNPGGPTAMSIDMDPSATPASTATSLGTLESCGRINENNIMDADEDVVDGLVLDVTVEGVTPPDPSGYGGLIGYEFRLDYVESMLTIDSAAGPATGKLGADPGSMVLNVSQALPDTNGDDQWTGSAADITPSPGASLGGDGYLDRLTLVTDSGAAAGVYPLSLNPGLTAIVDIANVFYTPETINDAVVAVNTACPTPVDLKVTSVTAASPASVPAGNIFSVTADATVHNNGPTPSVNADVVVVLNVPPDCAVSGSSVVTVQNLVLASSVAVAVPQQVFSVACTEPSFHAFNATATVVLVSPGAYSTVPSNNSMTSPDTVTAVTADADIKIASQSFGGLPAPKLGFPPVLVGQPLIFDVIKTVHNNGPSGPLGVQVTPNASVSNFVGGLQPGDCTLTNLTPPLGGSVTLPPSVSMPITETFSLSCGIDGMGNDTDGDTLIDEDPVDSVDNDGDTAVDEDAPYLLPTVCVTNGAWAADPHVSDPAPGNNSTQTCQIFLLERTFTPSFLVVQSSGDNPADPADPPVGDACYPGQPCEQLLSGSIPGGQPLAGLLSVIPGDGGCTGAYYVTRGTSDPCGNGTVPNGVVVARSSLTLTVKIGPGASPCNVPVSAPGFNLLDGAIPAFFGEGPDSSAAADLANPSVWPTRLEASPLFLALNAGAAGGYAGAPIWSRMTTMVPGLGIPANTLIFNLGPSGFGHTTILGDPSVPPASGAQPCAPISASTNFLGETGLDDPSPGRDLRVCNAGAPNYIVYGQFTRNDTGQSVTLADANTCAVTDADLKATSVSVSAPNAITGLGFWVWATVVAHNNGPFGPVSADLSATLSAPPDCTILTPNPNQIGGMSLALSAGTVTGPGWLVECSASGQHSFSVEASVLIPPGVTDPAPGNNTAVGAAVNQVGPPGEIHGTKWDDQDANGVRNGEPGLPGVEICLYSLTPPDEVGTQLGCTFTDGNGDYQFLQLVPGFYRVAETPQAGRGQTFPPNGQSHFVTVQAGVSHTGIDFGNGPIPPGAIAGTKFNDANGDGIKDPGELGVAGHQHLHVSFGSVHHDGLQRRLLVPGRASR